MAIAKPISIKRYGANISFYIHALNDKEAKAFLDSLIKDMNKKFDNSPRANNLVQVDFGSMEPRKVELNN